MTQAGPRVSPTVVALPAEIDMSNCDQAGADLRAACTPGATVVVADMTATTFCDARAIRALVLAHEHAVACGAELRLVVPSASVLRVLDLLGLGSWMAIYPSLRQALALQPGPETPVVVEFPEEFESGNAGEVAERLRAAIAPGVSVVVADLTRTAFCDSSGVRIMLLARDWAKDDNVELRLAVPPGPTLVVLKLVTLDELLPIYPSLEAALAGQPVLDADAPQV